MKKLNNFELEQISGGVNINFGVNFDYDDLRNSPIANILLGGILVIVGVATMATGFRSR